MQQVAAIQHGNDLDTFGQDPGIQLLYFLVDGVERGLLLGALEHQNDALDYVGLVDDDTIATMSGAGHVSQADPGAPPDVGYVLNSDGRSGLIRQDRLFDVLRIADEPQSSNVYL